MNFGGLKVVANELCASYRTEFKVERHPIKKRRRNWRVVRHTVRDISRTIVVGDTVYMHPEVFEKLIAAVPAQEGEKS